jgi:hypothetical protein
VAELVVSSADTVRLFRQETHLARLPGAVTAFVGRALKGPTNTPVSISSFAEFQRVFGGLWQPSMLSYAVEQFFDHGGRQAIIVRVTNSGRPPTMDLRTTEGHGTLRLIGTSPGTREYLRASVDYDGIGPQESDRFNLVVQRLRAPGSEFIDEQETYRRVSVSPRSDHYVANALARSALVRVTGDPPSRRPMPTPGSGPASVGYVAANPDGDDGDALSDYDLIGDPAAGSGLSALAGVEYFNFVYLPPLARDRDVGLPALLVALRLCRQRQAILLVDPPLAWNSVATVLERLPEWPLRSGDAAMFYPRLTAFDRLRGRTEQFPASAAAAGLLARCEERMPLWSAGDDESLVLRAGLRPALEIDEAPRAHLVQCGINVLQSRLSHQRVAARTLLPDSGGSAGAYLAARRLLLFTQACVLQGTRWMIFEHSSPPLWRRAEQQVREFLDGLMAEGAFASTLREQSCFVICDERLNSDSQAGQGAVRLLFGIATLRPGEFQACLVTHRAGGSTARAVSVNRLALAGQRIEAEIETAILRALVAL